MESEFFMRWLIYKVRKRLAVRDGRYEGRYYRVSPSDVR
jgi:hypothetical protein